MYAIRPLEQGGEEIPVVKRRVKQLPQPCFKALRTGVLTQMSSGCEAELEKASREQEYRFLLPVSEQETQMTAQCD